MTKKRGSIGQKSGKKEPHRGAMRLSNSLTECRFDFGLRFAVLCPRIIFGAGGRHCRLFGASFTVEAEMYEWTLTCPIHTS